MSYNKRSGSIENNSIGNVLGSHPRKTVVGFSPSLTEQESDGSSKTFGGVQDIRRKTSLPNADSIVSSQLTATSYSTVDHLGTSAGNRSFGKRGSISMSFPVGSPNRRSFEERLFGAEIQNKSKASLISSGGSSIHTKYKDTDQTSSTTIVELSPQKGNDKTTKAAKGQKTSKTVAIKSHQDKMDPNRKSQKNMTKAERRELQERQRAEKKELAASGQGRPDRSKNRPINTPANSNQQHHQNQGADQMRTTSPSASGPSLPTMRTPAQMRFDDSRARSKIQKASAVVRVPAQKPVTLFSHLMQYEHENVEFAENRSRGHVHPAVLSLGLHFHEFSISGGNARCIAMLDAFKKVILDYTTPLGTSLQRHLTQHISKQVDFLSNMRSLSASMKSAIRKLKSVISGLSIDTPDEDAKASIYVAIETYIEASITLADTAIVSIAINEKKIKDGDVVLTYARSSVVLKLLHEAHDQGIKFSVVVADGRPKLEGKEMLKQLVRAGIKCTYTLTSALPFTIKDVTKVFLGASCVLSNGDVMARVGTSVVAMTAYNAKIPIIVLCEKYKFSETVRLDSFVWNEIGRSDDLMDISNLAPSNRLATAIPNPDQKAAMSQLHPATVRWRDIEQLRLLNLFYDMTPAKFITLIICESGQIPSNAVLIIMRDYNDLETKVTLQA
ncbi:hypothetical protein O5D80_005195 [Batrachochytrium dendrobatidis]|nr:hypothetical protein O5D80_005195 [Batrachochytrium dendrobatidis]